MTSIKVLALREKRAEADRKHAEDSWRSAWWGTTQALGEISDKEELAKAISTVVETTGQTRGYITARARTGSAFHTAGYIHRRQVVKLPPRMAMELVSRKVEITDEVIHGLKEAELTGMSLREYATSLTGKAWADTPAGASKETVQEIIKAQPRLVGQLVAQHETASQAHDAEVLSRYNPIQAPKPVPRWDSADHALTELTLAVKHMRHECEKTGDLTQNARQTLSWAIAELTAIRDGRDFVGEVEAWLEGNTV